MLVLPTAHMWPLLQGHSPFSPPLFSLRAGQLVHSSRSPLTSSVLLCPPLSSRHCGRWRQRPTQSQIAQQRAGPWGCSSTTCEPPLPFWCLHWVLVRTHEGPGRR